MKCIQVNTANTVPTHSECTCRGSVEGGGWLWGDRGKAIGIQAHICSYTCSGNSVIQWNKCTQTLASVFVQVIVGIMSVCLGIQFQCCLRCTCQCTPLGQPKVVRCPHFRGSLHNVIIYVTGIDPQQCPD